MAPVNPLTTYRYKVTYAGPGGTHTALFHGELDGGSIADLRGDVADYVDQAKQMQWSGTVWASAQFAVPGDAFFTDDPDWAPITAATAASYTTSSNPSMFLNFVGREISGPVRVKLYLFETFLVGDNQMRFQVGDVAGIDAIITELNSVDNQICSIAGNLVTWKTYANLGSNDYLTHRARRS
jgi:hypothetical protein